jgi:hypothetical protein
MKYIRGFLLSVFYPHIRLAYWGLCIWESYLPVKTFPVALSDFEFLGHSGFISMILAGSVPDHSLSEQSSEMLDLELVWTRHRDDDRNGFSRSFEASLKKAWLWHRCAQAMAPDSFYHHKALAVAKKHFKYARLTLMLGSREAATMMRCFLRDTYGKALSLQSA